jgi:hypothetical protein
MSPFEVYCILMRSVLRGRALGLLSEQVEDGILDQMDRLWASMSAAERARIDATAADVPAAPERLGVVDAGLGEWPHRLAS